MDLSTSYLGLRLRLPIIPGASPLGADLDLIRRLEDAGAPAVVLPSLFEEQFPSAFGEREGAAGGANGRFTMRPEEYCGFVSAAKAATDMPIIGSMNGRTCGAWLRHAREIEQAGADALELNVYSVERSPSDGETDLEFETLNMALQLKGTLQIPIAIKISPYYTSLGHLASYLELAGADGLVLFNRFYRRAPDTDASVDALSTPADLPLRLHWLSILSGALRCSLAASGGIHDGIGAARALQAGASAVQVVSVLLMKGPEHFAVMAAELREWLERNGHDSVGELKRGGEREPSGDPRASERLDYIQALRGWQSAAHWPPRASSSPSTAARGKRSSFSIP